MRGRRHYDGAGLVSPPRDYDRFLAMLLGEGAVDGVRIMKPDTAQLAMSDLLPSGVALPKDFGGGGFGAGGRVSLAPIPGGQGADTYGWGGAAGTVAWVDRTRGNRGSGFIQKCSAAIHHRPDKVPELYIDEIDVAAAWQRQGVAKALLDAMFALGKSQGCGEAWVGTEANNVATRYLYESRGAQPIAIFMYEYDFDAPGTET